MPKPEIFSLGTLQFEARNFEVPEDLEFGLTTLGGTEPIPQTDGNPAENASQTVGVVCKPIAFDAWFIGADGEANGQKLQALQKAQAALPFQRGARSYDVVIFETSLKYRSANEIAYAVQLDVLAETTAGPTAPSSSSSVADNTSAVQTLLAAAPPDVRLDDSATAAGDAVSTLLALGPVDAAPVANVSAAVIALVAAIDLIQALEGELAASVLPADVSTYLAAAGLSGALSVLVASLGPLTGASSTAIAPGPMNLYEFAVQHTGDIGNVDAIMAANPHITDPFNLGTMPIAIPGL